MENLQSLTTSDPDNSKITSRTFEGTFMEEKTAVGDVGPSSSFGIHSLFNWLPWIGSSSKQASLHWLPNNASLISSRNAHPNERFLISGSHIKSFNGDGGHYFLSCDGKLFINGSPQSIDVSSGELIVNGTVTGNVIVSGTGHVQISGDVDGQVVHNGSGNLLILGDVGGDIFLNGSGSVKVEGFQKKGLIYENGNGSVTIYEGDSGNYSIMPKSALENKKEETE